MPKEISDQIKEDMKGIKKEFGVGAEAEESSSHNKGEESSDTDESLQEHETFTEIPIEVITEDE